MEMADEIREHALNSHIRPARREGRRKVVFLSGEIHDEMRLRNRFPAVCGAIGSQKFLDMANVDMWVKPPINGASTEFHCTIL